MRFDRKRALSLATAGALLLLAGLATATDVPLRNWSPAPMSASRTPLLSDIGGPLVFVPVTPCRVVDTRGGAPFTGGAFAAAESRDYQFSAAAAPCNGLPAGVRGFSINVTVTGTAGAGFLAIYPRNGKPVPLVSTINYVAGQTIANAASVPTDASGFITVLCGAAGTQVIVDVNGYYIGNGSSLNAGERLWIEGSYSSGGMIKGTNNFNGASSYGGFFETYATTNEATGVYGDAWGATGVLFGVIGETHSTTNGTAGVWGQATGASGKTYGVLGESSSADGQSYGVVGIAGGATWNAVNTFKAGGRFVGGGTTGHGVTAEGITTGVIGYRVDDTGALQTYGSVGYLGTDGLYTPQHLTAIGGKSFAEPHPTDASKIIKYVCPEGPESGTYIRGRGRFVNRTAVIEVPEHFRIVTEEEGLTVQITPIGRAASVGVVWIGLDRIEVESTRDVEFSYLVQGVRKAYKDWQPVQDATATENPYFVPPSASHKLEGFWPQEIRQRLISNGTYNPDGTVNMRTAERMGWAQRWRDEEKARAEAASRTVPAPAAGPAADGQPR
jgi:hypothetical protein